MLTSDHHAVTPCCGFTIWYTFNHPEGFITQEIIIYLLLPVKGTGAGVWHALGGAAGSTWISTGGPSILGSARCGHVLKVEEEYLSSSHALILSLLVGMHGNGSSASRGGVASCWGHEHVASYEELEAMHPLLKDCSVLTISDS